MERIMVSINYTRLFNLWLGHSYYGDGKAYNLHLRPTGQTLKKLRGAAMLFKTIPGGCVILYRAQQDETTPFVNLPRDQKFTFILTSQNKAEFQNITHLDISPDNRFSSTSILYFSNNPDAASTDSKNPEEITHSLISAVKNSLFTYPFTLENPPAEVLLRVTDSNGDPVSPGNDIAGTPLPETLTLQQSDDGSYSRQIDLRQKPTGLYTFSVRTISDDSTLREEQFYVDDDLVSRDLLGIVDIIYATDSDHLFGDTEEYKLTFSRKETIWTYFIVNKNGNVVFDDHDLVINDHGSSGYSAVQFNRDGDEPHADIKINGYDTVVFKSNAPIPFKNLPKSDVQLIRNPGSNVLIKNLPNPSYNGTVKEANGNLESEIYVFI